MVTPSLYLFAISALGIASVFVLYPLVLAVAPRRRRAEAEPPEEPPHVTVVVAVRNGAHLIAAKIENTLALDWPAERLDLIVSSDGSTDRTEEIVRSYAGPRVTLLVAPEHQGKSQALNRAVPEARGELVLFTDADALLSPQAVRHLADEFRDPEVGGVCGERVVGESGVFLGRAQQGYIRVDSGLKVLEARAGSLTSNDGKIYCVRRSLCVEIPDGVNDDLYMTLSVVTQGSYFVFAPGAQAQVRVPSRSAGHELDRRRRIAGRSLRTLWLRRELFNPLRFGLFAFGLAVNRVGRRLLPFFLVGLLASNVVLALESRAWGVVLALQILFYAGALSHGALARFGWLGLLRRATGLAHYFTLGNVGTLLGVFDVLAGRDFTRWEPRKTSEASSEPAAPTSADP